MPERFRLPCRVALFRLVDSRNLGLEVIAMEAAQGDRIIVHGRTVGSTDRHGVILEVRGQGGTPPYVVRFDDGHETIMYPGGDFAVERGNAR